MEMAPPRRAAPVAAADLPTRSSAPHAPYVFMMTMTMRLLVGGGGRDKMGASFRGRPDCAGNTIAKEAAGGPACA